MERDLLASKLQEPLPLWDLFEHVRARGMTLTLDQYDLFRQTIWLGYVTIWDDLERVCRLLWVKPSDGNRQQQLFDRAFASYLQGTTPIPEVPERFSPGEDKQREQMLKEPLQWPPLPLRPLSLPEQRVGDALSGIETLPPHKRSSSGEWQFFLSDLPVSASMVKESWRAWRRPKRQIWQEEIDVEQTVAQIDPMGLIEEIVWYPSPYQKSELIVLVDKGDNMLPYLPAVTALVRAVEERSISPAQIFRFTSYPAKFLYHWRLPNQTTASENLLKRLHPARTIVLVVSDAGAAIGSRNDDRVRGTLDFLERWQKSVRQILWLNPVPMERWAGTPAAEIQVKLGSRMLAFEQFNGVAMRRLMQSRSWRE